MSAARLPTSPTNRRESQIDPAAAAAYVNQSARVAIVRIRDSNGSPSADSRFSGGIRAQAGGVFRSP